MRMGIREPSFSPLTAEPDACLNNGRTVSNIRYDRSCTQDKDGRALVVLIATRDIEFDSRSVETDCRATIVSYVSRAEKPKWVDESAGLVRYLPLWDGTLLDAERHILDFNERTQLSGYGREELSH